MTQNDPEFLSKIPIYKEVPLEYLPTAEVKQILNYLEIIN